MISSLFCRSLIASQSSFDKLDFCRFPVNLNSCYLSCRQSYLDTYFCCVHGNKYPETINQRFSKSFIIEGLLFVLENNIFHFNDEYFKQMIGTAMGTDVALTFSILTVGYSEIKLYNLCEQNRGVEIRNYVYENSSRFVDDC